jgi:signal transduction histidine kinase
VQDLSLHVLDIIENSIRAAAQRVDVTVREDVPADALHLIIADDGAGMDDETRSHCFDPFFTTKDGRRIGLGLSLLAQAAQATAGGVEIQSSPEGGTRIEAVFGLTHPDLKPLGDMQRTIDLLRMAHPEIEFSYLYETRSVP